ncbi:MAG: Cof-type HAD-IIB family hydrolase [Turicibacter sp.]|nr:Cof-type HAD-IIB family hydrolase [Turicibacter sp.]
MKAIQSIMKKMIVVDLDGTLLHDEFSMNPLSKQALLDAKEAGHAVVIATGRPLRESIHFYRELGLDTPIINTNGSQLHHPDDSNFEEWVEHMSVQKMVEIFNSPIGQYLLNGVCEFKDHLYIGKADPEFTAWMNLEGAHSVAYSPWEEAEHPGFCRFILKIEPGKAAEVEAYLKENFPDEFSYYQWQMGEQLVFEIGKGGISKATAIARLADKLGFSVADIIVFGDGTNDVEMLAYAGVGVAMGNACDELKAVADAVTLGHQEGGIAHYLYEHVLKGQRL